MAETLTTSQVMALAKVSRQAVHQAMARGALGKCSRLGMMWMVPAAAAQRYATAQDERRKAVAARNRKNGRRRS